MPTIPICFISFPAELPIQKQIVPSEVFDSLKQNDDDDEEMA